MTDESIAAEPMCMCKDRSLDKCPGEWEPGCDLGNNEKFVRVGRASPEVLRASSGSRPSEAMRAAYIELRDAFGDHDRFDTLLSKYAEACTAMGVAIASFRAPMISLNAVAAEPRSPSPALSTRNTPICPYCNKPAVGWSAEEAKRGRKESPGLTTFHCRMAAD